MLTTPSRKKCAPEECAATKSFRLSEDGQHIELTFIGEINRRSALETNEAANALGRQVGVARYLVDVTRARNTDSINDQYNFAYQDLRQSKIIDRAARVAILIDPADRSHDFIETVTRNAGFNAKLFTCRTQALAFLTAEGEI